MNDDAQSRSPEPITRLEDTFQTIEKLEAAQETVDSLEGHARWRECDFTYSDPRAHALPADLERSH